MEIQEFLALVVPFIIVVYIAALLLLRPTQKVLFASLLGGLIMALINILVDFIAYYAGWWYYTLDGLILHVPLPFYLTPMLIYGSVVYLVIWRFRTGSGRWFAFLMLFAVPIFGCVRDILGALDHSSYVMWQSSLAGPATIVMWLLMFYVGYWVFQRLAPSYEEVLAQMREATISPPEAPMEPVGAYTYDDTMNVPEEFEQEEFEQEEFEQEDFVQEDKAYRYSDTIHTPEDSMTE